MLALGLPDVDPLLASLTVPQNLLVSETNRQVNESPKNKVIMSTAIDQQERSRCKKLRHGQDTLLLWRKSVNKDKETYRTSQLSHLSVANAKVDVADKLDSTARKLFTAIDLPKTHHLSTRVTQVGST